MFIKVKSKAFFTKLISKMELYTTFQFNSKSSVFMYQDINRLISSLQSYETHNEVMIDYFLIDEKFLLYILILDNIILLFDKINYQKYQYFLKSKQVSYIFLNNESEKELNLKYETKEIFDFSQNDISFIQSKIQNCLIKKSQIQTQQRHQNINSNTFDINRKYEMDDFLQIKNICENVSLCYNLNDQFLYIIKSFNKYDKESSKYYKRELSFYQKISNQNHFICKFFGTIQDRFYNSIVIEYIEGKTLEELIIDNKIESFEKIKIILQIIMTTEFIHLNDFALRDLKSNNIIIDSDMNAIFFDFDRAKKVTDEDDNQEEHVTKNFGCEYFLSPEQYLHGKYSFESDVYSIGIIIHSILNEKQYDDILSINILNELYKSKESILNNQKAMYIPEEYQFLFDSYKNCLEFNSQLRPNITELFYTILRSCNSHYKEKIYPIINSLYNIRMDHLNHIFGDITFFSKEISCDIQKFTNYLQIASNQNDSYAQFYLGKMYYEGIYLPFDLNKALHLIKLSVDQNNSYAQLYLGFYYEKSPYISSDINKAYFYYNLSSTQNNKYAQYIIGTSYLIGEILHKDVQKGIYYLTLSANQNYSLAQYDLGVLYLRNELIEPDINKSIHYLTLAAEQEMENAYIELHKIYFEGKLIKKDIPKSLYYLNLAYEHKNTYAMIIYSYLYMEGKYVDKNINKSIEFLTLASNLNDTNAQVLLGRMYISAFNVPKDVNKAIYYFKLAASLKNAEAYLILGIVYYNGLYIDRDIEQAIHYLTLAEKHNINDAHLYLGIIYSTSAFNKVKIDKALYHLSIASKSNPLAFYCIGLIFYYGNYVIRDIDKAIYYFKLGANQNQADSLHALGRISYNKADYKKALYYYQASSKLNNPNSYFMLGGMYLYGYGVKQNVRQAIKYLSMASDLKHREALYVLGCLYVTEEYIKKDVDKAIHYFTLASNLDDAKSQYNLALIYYRDEQHKKDFNKAINYFKLAAKKNHHGAQFYLGLIYYEGKYIKSDINRAIYYFKECSSFNLSFAKNCLGVIYLNGKFVERNIYAAMVYFNEAIKLKNCIAFYNLARIYYFGIDVEKNINKAIQLLKKSIENKFVFAIVVLYTILCDNYNEELKHEYENCLENMKNNYMPLFLYIMNAYRNDEFSKKFFPGVISFFQSYDMVHYNTDEIVHDLTNFIFKNGTKPKKAQNLTNEFYEGFKI